MEKSAPLELLADATGSVTFGWAGEHVYYARFSRCLSARLGQSFAARLGAALTSGVSVRYFADARDLDSYDLTARSSLLGVLTDQRCRLERLEVLWWQGSEPGSSFRAALGDRLHFTLDASEFEAQLTKHAPQARSKLVAKPESPHRSRWPLRR